MMATHGLYFVSPWWLLGGLLVIPTVWLALHNLTALGRTRRAVIIVLRVLVVLTLVAVLARPTVTRTADRMTVIAVIDRSRSIQPKLQARALAYLAKAMADKPAKDRLAVIDVAEEAYIARLPSTSREIPQRSTTLRGILSRLSSGIELAMVIAPPETSTRLLLVSDGCETAGDLREVARVAAANRIPIDVLPLRFQYDREVAFKRLVVPARARNGQTIHLRCVLRSTHAARGRILLKLNGIEQTAIPVVLKPGTNVSMVTVKVGARGVHEYEAEFIPQDANQDQIPQNNRASGVTFVAGAGHVLVVEGDGPATRALMTVLENTTIDARAVAATEFPTRLSEMLDVDAVVLVNTDNSQFTMQQQNLLCRYVTELGGGMIMIGGANSFGAGGWIGSPVAKIIPVDLDPPQKKVMVKGALVLIMHACEMPKGNYWGKQVGIAAVNSLSRLDLVGVIDYSWDGKNLANWVYPLAPVGDRKKVIAGIKQMTMGDMPDLAAPLQAAYTKLRASNAGQKHIIIITDGDPSGPSLGLLKKLRAARISVSGVIVFPHSAQDKVMLSRVARYTGGNFYHVKDPKRLPQIFIKEAQIVRRSLILEEPFTPKLADSSSEIVRGLLSGMPGLKGYVRSGVRGGLTQVVLTSHKGDPILATGQFGLGRCVAFTSSIDSRWAASWLAWGGFERFWEQAVRWVARSPQSPDCEVHTDVQGRDVTLWVRATGESGSAVQFARITGQVIAPDEKMTTTPISLSQVGPGEYQASFRAEHPGAYLVNLRYRKAGAKTSSMVQAVVSVPYAPEFDDLTDNAALLHEVAAVTGGRVLPSDPEAADLFSRGGIDQPRSAAALTMPLMLLWVVLFLLDVAVRRITVDFRAIARRAGGWLGRLRPRAKSDKTVDQLRARHRKLRKQLYSQTDRSVATRRYDAAGKAEAPLPDSQPADTDKTTEKPQAAKPDDEAPAQDEQPKDHVQRLLQKRRQRRGPDERKPD